jgi:putative NADH-flavin reductase
MKVTIFGANGRVGSLVVEEALSQGYEVVAFVHHSLPAITHQNLSVIQGDIYDPKVIESAIKGSDVVISALGSWHTKKKDILSIGMENILPAMKQLGVSRIITLTGADARAGGDKLSIIHKFSHVGINLTNGKIMKDSEKHISMLEASDLNWTIIRSPIMNEKCDAAKYQLTTKRPLPWQTINRHSVAKAMVAMIITDEFNRKAPYILRTK